MRLLIVNCDDVGAAISSTYGQYGQMLERAMLRADRRLEILHADALTGPLPEDHLFDAALISGSRADAFGSDLWIRRLIEWVCRVDRPLAGICFWHQLLAQAFGGQVARAPGGWGVGHQSVYVLTERPWMTQSFKEVRVLVSHQDQVLRPPQGALPILSAPYCPQFSFEIPGVALGLQGHPEFDAGYARLLLERRRGIIDHARIDAAIQSLAEPTDAAELNCWIINFLRMAQ